MKEIPLTHGKVALVDDEDFEWLSAYRWSALPNRDTFYAYCTLRLTRGACTSRRMHRLIVEAPAGVPVDHQNGDGLDNRRSNLRPSTGTQNQANRRRHSNNTSGFKGVIWKPRRSKWRAQIKVCGRTIWLGEFTDKVAAARAYDVAAIRYFGEFASTNF